MNIRQAPAREGLARRFKAPQDPFELVVDYLGLAGPFRRALAVYPESGGTSKAVIDQEQATQTVLE